MSTYLSGGGGGGGGVYGGGSDDDEDDDVYKGSSGRQQSGQGNVQRDSVTGAQDDAEGDDDFIDIYQGLDTSAERLRNIELQQEVEKLRKENGRLKADNAELSECNKELEDLCFNLENNISCLYKTAKAEIKRKDATIRSLRAAAEGARRRRS
eukprot:g4291.t1